LIFAVYYTKLSPVAISRLGELFPVFKTDMNERYPLTAEKQISICFQSIRLIHPTARCVVLTDLETTFSLPEYIEVIRYDVDPNEPVYMRMRAQTLFLESLNRPMPVIFCDYDMIFQQSLENLFKQSFDLALSCRKEYKGNLHPEPINGGLLIVHPNGISQVITFLKTLHDYFTNHLNDYRVWGGDQGTLNQFIGVENVHRTFPGQVVVDGTTILLLSALHYNYAIGGEPHFVEYHPEKAILHFKGSGKRDMEDYWNSYLKPKTSS
jgi:hypothetical protein